MELLDRKCLGNVLRVIARKFARTHCLRVDFSLSCVLSIIRFVSAVWVLWVYESALVCAVESECCDRRLCVFSLLVCPCVLVSACLCFCGRASLCPAIRGELKNVGPFYESLCHQSDLTESVFVYVWVHAAVEDEPENLGLFRIGLCLYLDQTEKRVCVRVCCTLGEPRNPGPVNMNIHLSLDLTEFVSACVNVCFAVV